MRTKKDNVEYTKKWKLANPEKVKIQSRVYYLKHKKKLNKKHREYARSGGNLKRYNLTLKKYNELLDKQGGLCAICKCKETSLYRGRAKKLSVDHDHKLGNVRGLLCNSCNRGIGYMRDNVVILQGAVKYLKKYEKEL